ncbi:hypothetical protein P5G51_011930 [Virgibacillus sp. 179-BFC.A HS]|uniref:Uncharacterized protein n=1 Tax=Tigheibacillus jepli TaxID=3035914 RepID=A0ABU5CI57_9BACI|nr:hypothetical protein [Virgibacillus sp. 179-BFC.A HS]MDY0406005.1 hypothetical protein [Virgibacillus sp. 179-BFC.A HS]
MKKRYLAAIGALGVGAATSYFIKNRKKEDNADVDPMTNAGVPDEVENNDIAQLENSKMVSEGSQFGVQYYNKAKENEA